MKIENNIIKHYLRNVYFITGTAYAGKATMVRMLAEKKFLLNQIKAASNPEKAMENFKNCLAMVNSRENYEQYFRSGFFTLIRKDVAADTKEEVMNQLAKHFG